jgi:hypothetical protein
MRILWSVLLLVPTALAVTTVYAGDRYTCAIIDGRAACWGYNADLAIGRSTTDSYGATAGDMANLVPITFPSPTLVVRDILRDSVINLFTQKQACN